MKRFRRLLAISFVALTCTTSCTIEKRLHRPGYHVDWKSGKNSIRQDLAHHNLSNSGENIAVIKQPAETTIAQRKSESNEYENISASASDEIILSNKTSLLTEVKNPTASETVEPSFKTEFKKGFQTITQDATVRRVPGMAITGFIAGIVGLFVFGIILGILAVIFSAIGLGKTSKEPNLWKGQGFAIAGLVLGIIDILGALLFIALMA